MILRDYQIECVDKMLEVSKIGGKYGIKLPTASGKTIIYSKYISSLVDKTILVIVHRDELVTQTVEKFSRFGLKARIEKAESSASDEYVQEIYDRVQRQRGRAELSIEYNNKIKENKSLLIP